MSVALSELVFHLYLNAFRDRDSVFMRESGGSMRGERFAGPRFDRSLDLAIDGADALKEPPRAGAARLHATRGASRQAAVAWRGTNRKHVRRHPTPGVRPQWLRRGLLFVAQWFPKLAKLERDGSFASFPYHALGEFYADFADYEFTVRTPSEFVVGANGKLLHEVKERSTPRALCISPALDAVWVAASPCDAARERRDVAISYLYAPGYELALEEHDETVRAGLEHFGSALEPTLTEP